jgi:hypothetical protein
VSWVPTRAPANSVTGRSRAPRSRPPKKRLLAGLDRGDALARDERVREAKAEIADRGVLQVGPAAERADAGARLDEGDGQREVELQSLGHAVREEEVAADLVVDDVLVAAARAGRRHTKENRPRLVGRHQAERDQPLADRLRSVHRREARRARIRPERVAVDARVDERVRTLLGVGFTC